MNKKTLKAISLGLTVTVQVINIVNTVVSNKLGEMTLAEKAMEFMSNGMHLKKGA